MVLKCLETCPALEPSTRKLGQCLVAITMQVSHVHLRRMRRGVFWMAGWPSDQNFLQGASQWWDETQQRKR